MNVCLCAQHGQFQGYMQLIADGSTMHTHRNPRRACACAHMPLEGRQAASQRTADGLVRHRRRARDLAAAFARAGCSVSHIAGLDKQRYIQRLPQRPRAGGSQIPACLACRAPILPSAQQHACAAQILSPILATWAPPHACSRPLLPFYVNVFSAGRFQKIAVHLFHTHAQLCGTSLMIAARAGGK